MKIIMYVYFERSCIYNYMISCIHVNEHDPLHRIIYYRIIMTCPVEKRLLFRLNYRLSLILFSRIYVFWQNEKYGFCDIFYV